MTSRSCFHACVFQELAAIKARVQELEMEEESDRLRDDEERCDAAEMQLLTSSPRPGETAHASYAPRGLLLCHIVVQLNTDHAFGKPRQRILGQVCSMAASRQVR